MSSAEQQSRTEKKTTQLRAVTADDIRALYEAARGAPEANRLLSINEILSEQVKDYAKADAIIRDVRNRYERRHLRILRSEQSSDEKRKKKAATTLALFAEVLERLDPMVRAQAARADVASKPIESPEPSPVGSSVNPNRGSNASQFESAEDTLVLAGLAPEMQELMGVFGSVSREIGHTRLVQNETIIVEVGNIAAEIGSAGRQFRHGRPEEAIKKAKQLSNAFVKKVNQWEERARKKEKLGHTLSMDQRKKMEAEHHNVRRQYRLALKQFQRLLGALDHHEKQMSSSED